jgi:hypothetical protein
MLIFIYIQGAEILRSLIDDFDLFWWRILNLAELKQIFDPINRKTKCQERLS